MEAFMFGDVQTLSVTSLMELFGKVVRRKGPLGARSEHL
jgi:hypothetical protein